jgi:peptidoglycan/LPS O-acetylase OafA/YrhL
MAMLGRYSYGIYIWHIFAASVALSLFPGREPTGALVQIVEYGAAIAVGVLATVAVEKPVLRLRERLLPAADHVAQDPSLRERAAEHRAAHPARIPATPHTRVFLPARHDALVRVGA